MEQYTIYEEPLTGSLWRDGVRDSKWVIDKAISPTAFAGTENVDWENVFCFD